MFRRIFCFAFEKWKTPIFDNLKKKGVWSLLASIISFFIISKLIGADEAKTEIIVFVSVVIGIIIIEIIRFIWHLYNAPFEIIKEQDGLIASLKFISDRKSIIGNLVELRKEGTELRNRGETLFHQSEIEPWWNLHLKWREKTKATMALLDPNKANQWETLNLYTPRRDFPKALNGQHRKYLQMFDVWLDRLQVEIDALGMK